MTDDFTRIILRLNVHKDTYDIYPLLGAFFPKSEILVDSPESKEPVGQEEYSSCPVCAFENVKDSYTVSWSTPGGEKVVKTTKTDVGTEMSRQSNPFKESNLPKDSGELRNLRKRLVYELLSEITGKSLPWGTLTGIRPTKISLKLFNDGKKEPEVFSYMKETYLTSDGKIQLASQVARREYDLLKKRDYEKGYSLYIGIPFCPSICLYCSFSSYALGAYEDQVEEYLKTLFKEIEYVGERFKDQRLDSIYVGGGTPTALTADQMDRLLRKVEQCLDISSVQEITVEAGRPDSITLDKLKAIRSHGVERISVNPQTMNDQTLELIGRHHSAADICRAMEMARNVGFSVINMDIILGLPGEGSKEVAYTLEELMKFSPENLTVHSLAKKRSARLSLEWEKYKDYEFYNSDTYMEMVREAAEKEGLTPYYLYRQKHMAGNLENIGYAKEGTEGLYNVLMMEEIHSIVALGAGSVTKRVWPDGHIKRCDNAKNLSDYMNRIDEMLQRKERLFSEGNT